MVRLSGVPQKGTGMVSWQQEQRDQALRNILSGPDTPGRRFLRRLQAEGKGRTMRGTVADATKLPPEVAEPSKTTATRDDIESLRSPGRPVEAERITEAVAVGSKGDRPPERHIEPLRANADFFAAHPVEDDDRWENG
jgi:hypothetical protein